jgi:serine/threonine protein phosphatase PrpC
MQTPLTSFLVKPDQYGNMRFHISEPVFRPPFTSLPQEHESFIKTMDNKGVLYDTQMWHPTSGPVSTLADVHSIKYSPNHIEWVILASDGLWDVMGHRQLLELLDESRRQDPTADVAKFLVDEALKMGTEDNTTVIAIRLTQKSLVSS